MENKIELIKIGENSYEVYFGIVNIGLIYRECDGLFVFFTDTGGCWEDYTLRAIANVLTKLNKDWNNFIKENS